ncbi:hypothetical protein PPYR_10747 [Photinus pyralis]|uniref:Glycine cleavage system H protein n=1 Tax=Photinus pyralis TaxID=7054 RepID=A0A1Y1N7K2_PHOPY|nr:glycine cleavage system H protein, mitochondrial [Photinus pyralis]XP_031351849.1 glycine cleavage system H protein, mitochondrial-like [Photinus pyralis]KAB0795460.1 hypothetical protein PPYR_12299 [Photinus pyralis]KAB0796686.1 hypothetical protein PPYR_10747 [Photinus pyralis]
MVIQRVIPRVALLINHSTTLNKAYNSRNVVLRLISTSQCNFAERYFTKKHEWVEVEGKIGIVGISDYAQSALGDVVYAQLPDVDSVLSQKDECGALESVKAASELYSPVSGRVVEKNESVEETPSLINTSCYDKGWLFKVELTNDKEITALMNESQYKEFLKSDEHH